MKISIWNILQKKTEKVYVNTTTYLILWSITDPLSYYMIYPSTMNLQKDKDKKKALSIGIFGGISAAVSATAFVAVMV